MKAKDLLSRVKTKFLINQPFFGMLACNAKWIEEPGIPTMATDGNDIYYNAEFVEAMTEQEAMFVVAHEVLHCAFQHLPRLKEKNYDIKRWNIATDICINKILSDDGVGTMPNGGISNPRMYDEGEGIADNIYKLLQDNGDKMGSEQGFAQPDPNKPMPMGRGSGDPQAFDEMMEPSGSELEQEQKAADMKVRVAQAANAAKAKGKLPAGLQRLVDEVLSPKVPWQDVLRDFVTAQVQSEMSYENPNRRYLWQVDETGIIRPSLSGEALGEMVVAVDCSGSIGPRELSEFAAEISKIKEDCNPEVIHILYFDSTISHYDRVEADDEVNIQMHGGGGTEFAPIFEFMAERALSVECCVVLTDLYVWGRESFGNEPDCPVLWVTTGKTEAPFGAVIKM